MIDTPSGDFLVDVAAYEAALPDEATLRAEYADLEARFLAAKESDDPDAWRQVKYEMRHARWYWRSIRDLLGAYEADEGGVTVGPGGIKAKG